MCARVAGATHQRPGFDGDTPASEVREKQRAVLEAALGKQPAAPGRWLLGRVGGGGWVGRWVGGEVGWWVGGWVGWLVGWLAMLLRADAG